MNYNYALFLLTMPHTKKCYHGVTIHGQPATGQKLGVIWTIGSWSMIMIQATWTHMIHDHDPGNWFDEGHGSWSWSDHCAKLDHDPPKSMVMIQNPHEFLPVKNVYFVRNQGWGVPVDFYGSYLLCPCIFRLLLKLFPFFRQRQSTNLKDAGRQKSGVKA